MPVRLVTLPLFQTFRQLGAFSRLLSRNSVAFVTERSDGNQIWDLRFSVRLITGGRGLSDVVPRRKGLAVILSGKRGRGANSIGGQSIPS